MIKSFLIDVEDSTPVYTDRTLPLFKELSSCAKDMFMWICAHLGKNTDVIEIPEPKYCAEMGVASRTFFKAKAELLNRVIVPRESRSNTYFVSPLYIYRGSRIKAYPDNVMIKSKDPLENFGKAEGVSSDNVPLQPVGMEIPEMFSSEDVASLDS